MLSISKAHSRFQKMVGAAPTLLLLTTLGCGSSNGRQAISGNVTMDGEVLSNASVMFMPLDSDLPTGGSGIHGGKFNIPATHGLFPGKYQVKFKAFRPTGKKVNDPDLGTIDELHFIEIKKIEPSEITVTGGGSSTFNFKIQAGT